MFCVTVLVLFSWKCGTFNSGFHYPNIRLFFSCAVRGVSQLEFALFYSICTPCMFQVLGMYFSIKNAIKINSKEVSKGI